MDIKKAWIIVVVCCLLFVVCLLIFWYQLKTSLSKSEEETIFIIEEGQGLKEIAGDLKTERIIKSRWVFIFYVWLRGKSKNLQAGEYSLNSAMSIPEIAKKLIQGKVIQDWVKVTIPEGWTNKQIEERLGKDLPMELEGYLFPDTYYFEKDSSIEEIVKKMRDNFDKKTESLTVNSEIIILASIVQNEVNSVEDMSTVAGIFYNRLKLGMPLQSDATVNYVTGKKLRQPLIEDTKIESPYNTYLHPGLPPGPISNPGLDAIKATIYPEDTDYLYFLNPLDGETIFSKTFEEHNVNKKKYLETLDNLLLK